MQEVAHQLGGTPSEAPDRYRSSSPMSRADQLRCPVLLVHGEQDASVPVSFTKSLATTLKKGGKTAGSRPSETRYCPPSTTTSFSRCPTSCTRRDVLSAPRTPRLLLGQLSPGRLRRPLRPGRKPGVSRAPAAVPRALPDASKRVSARSSPTCFQRTRTRPAFPKFVLHGSRSFCSLARRADAGILGNMSRRRNDASGQKGPRYVRELWKRWSRG